PTVIADRLARVFPAAKVVYVWREPLERFYSTFRQRHINAVRILLPTLIKFGQPEPRGVHDANGFFDAEWRRSEKHGIGFFCSLDIERLREAFQRYFSFQVI